MLFLFVGAFFDFARFEILLLISGFDQFLEGIVEFLVMSYKT